MISTVDREKCGIGEYTKPMSGDPDFEFMEIPIIPSANFSAYMCEIVRPVSTIRTKMFKRAWFTNGKIGGEFWFWKRIK